MQPELRVLSTLAQKATAIFAGFEAELPST